MSKIYEDVKEYYGKQLNGTEDLKTSACCTDEKPPSQVRDILPMIAEEIKNRFYGCGSPIPTNIEGKTILDLGCGTGRDVYIISKLVGESGLAIGIDMTAEQIETAKKYQDEQREIFDFKKSNVKFIQGYIEDLKTLGIADNSIDVVISNCVINLSPSKEQVFKEIFRVLKPGGELYFSDVFVDRRIPNELANDQLLRGECLSGALYVEDFRRIMVDSGFTDFRYIKVRNMKIDNEDVMNKIGFASFSSRTVRAFKIDGLEDKCEDYGQIAIYQGGVEGSIHHFDLDKNHRFFIGKPALVCGNTARMLSESRFGKYFSIIGDMQTHFGLFENCGESLNDISEIEGCC